MGQSKKAKIEAMKALKKKRLIRNILISACAVVLVAAIVVVCVVVSSGKMFFDVTSYGNSKSEMENISVSIVDYKFTNNKKEITVQWNNQSQYEVFISDEFSIYSLGMATWDEIEPVKEVLFEDVAYPIASMATYQKTYDLSLYFDEIKAGAYQFNADVHLSSNAFKTTVDFSIGEK